jgi:undecaprenyldiphospho-muramoylpentapeptide beta-N-acetylglucosaminyltransferase
VARVLVAAGASGGHVYPGLATAAVLRDRGHDVSFAGGDRLEARVVPAAGFPFHALAVRRPPSVRRELLTPRGVVAVASILRATQHASRLLRNISPDVVLGMGGFAGIPVALAASRAKLPLVLHEQNAHLSLAQRIPVRWATVLALGLPIAEALPDVRTELVGHPVRREIVALYRLQNRERDAAQLDARMRLGLEPSAPTLLVFGGSLGSGPLNDSVPRAHLPVGIQVLHISGPGNEETVSHAWERRGIAACVVGFLDAIEDGFLCADVAVSRSGASTVAELAIAGLPSVLVPLPTLKRGDQEANARLAERAGGAVVIMQSHEDFVRAAGAELSRLLSDAEARKAMSTAARSFAKPDAAERLADVVESVIR